MARTITIKIKSMEGLNRFTNKLKKAIPEAAEETVKTACLSIEKDAKSIVPVDTGALRDSINTKIEKNGDDITGIVSTNQYYAGYVEHGTSKMAAKPYMKPAFDKNKDDIENFYIETLKRKLR